jgi:hypothetical protein
MAQVDGSSNSGLAPYRSAYGAIAIRQYEESTCASSKVIAVGDIVCFDTVVTTHARILVAPSSQGAASNLLQNGITSLIGVAVSASTSDGSTSGLLASTALAPQTRLISVAIADGLTEFRVNISSVGATPDVPCSSMIGNTYPIECVRSAVGQKGLGGGHGVWFLSSTNLSTAADKSFVVTHIPSDQMGTTGGYVVGRFLSTMTDRSIRVGGPFT